MNEDSIRLLREVNEGCKNAVNSFSQVMDFIKDDDLREIAADYEKRHAAIGTRCHSLLGRAHKEEKDPLSVAKAVMWFTTEVKMMIDDDDSHVAELLADGCNMGIKSLSRYLRQYPDAGQEARGLAGKLIELEMELYKKLLAFL